MSRADDVAQARNGYEAQTAALVGQVVVGVSYWDVHNFSDEPRVWDYGDWHHAVMGVELVTATGPQTVIWTDTFFPYGVEVFAAPISDFLVLGEEGPEGWDASAHREWATRRDQPILRATTYWERFDVGPVRAQDGTIVGPPTSYDVPVALRLDFAAGPVWLVAAMPQWPDVEDVFWPADEIMVVFAESRMRAIGFPDCDFTRAPAPG